MTLLKKVAVGTAFAASITAASLGASAPAQALDLAGRTLSFGGSAKLENAGGAIGSSATLVFANNKATTADYAFFGITDGIGASDAKFDILNLTLEKTSATQWKLMSGVASWLSGGALGNVKYDLTSFILNKIGTDFEAKLDGFFVQPGQTVGTNTDPNVTSFTSQAKLAITGTTYSADIAAVPVPALLPGAVGVGLAALRKRKARTLATA
ncbi:MAG: hypothetical protein B0A82_17085 [Alkalinema sp. CACIAM 70d]|nr:MAG: hypothetical protein B0A82_17085 [Alkalinema sp. CACIAM 70d]